MLKSNSNSGSRFVTSAANNTRKINLSQILKQNSKNDGSASFDAGSQRFQINYLSNRPG